MISDSAITKNIIKYYRAGMDIPHLSQSFHISHEEIELIILKHKRDSKNSMKDFLRASAPFSEDRVNRNCGILFRHAVCTPDDIIVKFSYPEFTETCCINGIGKLNKQKIYDVAARIHYGPDWARVKEEQMALWELFRPKRFKHSKIIRYEDFIRQTGIRETSSILKYSEDDFLKKCRGIFPLEDLSNLYTAVTELLPADTNSCSS